MRIRGRRFPQSAVYGAVTAAPATTTWNPAALGSSLTLSTDHLTFTETGPGGFDSALGIASHSTGKFYFELVPNWTAGNIYVGLGNASTPLHAAFPSPAVVWGPGGQIFQNGGNAATIQTYVTGTTLCVAADLTNNKIWFRPNGGNWNNDVIANQNPATNTGGFTIGVTGGGPYFPLGTVANSTDAATANFGATAYAQSVPAGFGNW
jgi:hypothetical protein